MHYVWVLKRACLHSTIALTTLVIKFVSKSVVTTGYLLKSVQSHVRFIAVVHMGLGGQ